MEQHDIEIRIAPDGEVTVSVKGAKGKACLQYAEFLRKVVGEVKDQRYTSEYYEPEGKAGIDVRLGEPEH